MQIQQKVVIRHLLICWLLAATTLAHAETPAECQVEESRAQPFVQTYNEVKKVVQVLCNSTDQIFSTADIEQLTKTPLTRAREEASEVLHGYAWYVQPWFAQVWIEKGEPKRLIFPERMYKYITPAKKGLFRNGSIAVREISENELNICDSDVKQCDKKFEAMAYLLNAMTAPLKIKKLKVVRQYLIETDAAWDRFVTDARSQTFADIWATTWYYKKPSVFDERLNPPPSAQLFLFHPSIIIENVKAAVDGGQMKEGIAAELFGVNWWDRHSSPCGFPCGASITMTYTDLAGVKDEGIGLMFHFNNRYSIGFSNHGGHAGYYITVDLLKFLENKKNQLDAWKKESP